MQVAWQVKERLKTWDLTKLGNIRKISNLGRDSLPSRKKIGSSSQKLRERWFQSVILILFLTLFQIFCPGCKYICRICETKISVIVSGGSHNCCLQYRTKQLLPARWQTHYYFKNSYFHTVYWIEYLTE